MKFAKNFFWIALLFLIIGSIHWITSTEPMFMTASTKAADGEEELSFAQMTCAGAAMLVGIIFGNVHAMLNRSETGQSILLTFKATLNDPALYKSLLASPIIFGGVYTATLHSLDPVIAIIFAFQNGFFCEVILRKNMAR